MSSYTQPVATTEIDTARTASELRVVLGQLMRRLRTEHRFPIHQGAVLGRLDREGPVSVSDLAAAEKVRPQSMAQTVGELEADGLVKRRPDPDDRRRALVELTPAGRETLEEDRSRRVGWLVSAIEKLPVRDQVVLARATAIIGRLAEPSD
jgi:DNA-binding MarR family transcriptional regulator